MDLPTLIDTLADVFDSEAEVKSLLQRAGVPINRLPPFGKLTPQLFWQDVVGRLEHGLTEAGVAGLAATAAEDYPYNHVFKQWLSHGLDRLLDEAQRYRAMEKAEGKETKDLDARIFDLSQKIRQGRQLEEGILLLDGRFELLEKIGSGGFAQVWKAYDESSHDVVAIKALHGQYARDESRRERFFRGAHYMARFQDPRIVRVVEEGCEYKGHHFFVMEYVEGGDLREAVKAGRLDLEQRLQIILEVGKALSYAHAQGVIHRDVKPSNILLCKGRPKLTDFDLMRALDTTGGTRTTGLGSFPYAAPEAMMDAKEAAESADVYGLGMTAIFAFHGADLPADVVRGLTEFIEDLEVTEGCRAALHRAVAQKVEDRWPSVDKFCLALRDGQRVDSADAIARAALLYENTLLEGGSPSFKDRLGKLGVTNAADADRVARRFSPRSQEPLVETLTWLRDVMIVHRYGAPRLKTDPLVRRLMQIVDPDVILGLDPDFGHSNGGRFNWPAIPPVDDEQIQKLLKDGSVDTHIHLTGTLPPVFYWLCLMSGEFQADALRGHFLNHQEVVREEAWIQAIGHAVWLRLYLAACIEAVGEEPCFPWLEEGWHQLPQFMPTAEPPATVLEARGAVRALVVSQRFAGSQDMDWLFRDPLRSPADEGGRGHYASGERRMLHEIGKILQERPGVLGSCGEQRVLEYLRIRNAFYRLMIPDRGERSLERFIEDFRRRQLLFAQLPGDGGARGERQSSEHLVRCQLAAALDEQLVDPYTASTATCQRRIELRCSLPTESPEDLPRILCSWLRGIRDHLEGAGQRCHSQVGLVFHFVKKGDAQRQAERALREARCIGELLKEEPLLRPFIVGVDAAGGERSGHPRIFAPAFRHLRQVQKSVCRREGEPPICLGFTYHVGEDVNDLLTGLRHVDEVVNHLLHRQGRLGHGLVLGIDPKRFYQRRRRVDPAVHLLDLVWAWGRLRDDPGEDMYGSWLKGRIGVEDDEQVSKCFEAMSLDDPEEEPKTEEDLVEILLEGAERELAGEKPRLNDKGPWIDLAGRLQKLLLKRISGMRGICVEVSPTSNLVIGGFDDHTYRHYQSLTEAGIPVSINTDDPGFFMTSLPAEFSVLAFALENRWPREEALSWLKDRIKDAEESTFLNGGVVTRNSALRQIQEALTGICIRES